MTPAEDSGSALTCRSCGSARPDREDWATRCDPCLQRDGRAAWLIPAVAGASGGFLLAGGTLSAWPSAAAWLALGLTVGLLLSVVVHETGHALAGRIAGMRINRFVVGNGPLLTATRIGSVQLELRRYQGIGSTWTETLIAKTYRTQWTIFLLGGPVASILGAAVCLAFAARSGVGAALIGLGLANAFMALVALRPGRGLNGSVSSDINDLLVKRSMTDEEIMADVAYCASQRVLTAEAASRLDEAVRVASDFVDLHPHTTDADWFRSVLAELESDGDV